MHAGPSELSDLVDHSAERLQANGGVRLPVQSEDRVAANFVLLEGQDPETLLGEREIVVRSGKLAAEPRLPIAGVEKAVRTPLMFDHLRQGADLLVSVPDGMRPSVGTKCMRRG